MTMYSPAMLFLKRDICTRIKLLLPDLKTRVHKETRKGTYGFDDRKFNIGDCVAVRDYRMQNRTWKFEQVANQDGTLNYTVNVQGILVRRHIDQIRPIGNKVKDDCLSSLVYCQIPIKQAADSDSVEQYTKNSVPEV